MATEGEMMVWAAVYALALTDAQRQKEESHAERSMDQEARKEANICYAMRSAGSAVTELRKYIGDNERVGLYRAELLIAHEVLGNDD